MAITLHLYDAALALGLPASELQQAGSWKWFRDGVRASLTYESQGGSLEWDVHEGSSEHGPSGSALVDAETVLIHFATDEAQLSFEQFGEVVGLLYRVTAE
jgi:hypothetical protein